jgi:Erv1 / Alr family
MFRFLKIVSSRRVELLSSLATGSLLIHNRLTHCDDGGIPKKENDASSLFGCTNRACTSKMDMLKRAISQRNRELKADRKGPNVGDVNEGSQVNNSDGDVNEGSQVNSSDDAPESSSDTRGNSIDINKDRSIELDPKGCPLDKEELGRVTWSLIHTIAAYYPDRPTIDDQISALEFIRSLAHFYPCEECAQDFRDSVKSNPPM